MNWKKKWKNERRKTMLNIDAVKNHIKYFREDKYDSEFYIALLIYDILGYDEKQVDQEIVNRVDDIESLYESIYKGVLIDELRSEFKIEQEEIEEEIEI